jgi:DNA-binding NarL/FixJ family response regulator
MQASIIIADDHPLVLKGLNDFLLEKQYNVLASATNGKDAFQLIKDFEPDIAILDIRMPFLTGLEIAKICNEQNLSTKIIIITFEKDESTYKEAKALHIYGYVLKEFALVELENCIAAISNGKSYFSPELIQHLQIDEKPEELELLTPAEKRVLNLIAKNHTGVEIGDILCVSTRTVEKHKSHIIRKLELSPKQNSLLIWAKENQDYFL